MRSYSYDIDRDLLIGGQAIADYVNSLVDAERPISRKTIYFWIEQEHLPVRWIGARIVASKSKIRAHLGGSA